MVQAELAGGQALPAVLATMTVAGEEIAAVQPEAGAVLLVKPDQPHNPWDLNLEMHGADPIVVIALVVRAELAQLAPRFEIVVAKLPFFDVNDFSRLTIQQNERPARGNDPDRHVVAIQYEDTRV
jgi:hypothetical protein